MGKIWTKDKFYRKDKYMKARKIILCNYRGSNTPVLTIAGKYLKELGYEIGLRVEVIREENGDIRVRRLPDSEQKHIR